jgi:hypothetical protein
LGDFQIQPGIGQSALFEALPKISSALRLDVMQNGLGDQPAPIAFAGHAVKHRNRGVGQNNVKSFAQMRPF